MVWIDGYGRQDSNSYCLPGELGARPGAQTEKGGRQNWRPGWETRPGTTPVGDLTRKSVRSFRNFLETARTQARSACHSCLLAGVCSNRGCAAPNPPSSIPSLAGVEIPGSRSASGPGVDVSQAVESSADDLRRVVQMVVWC